MYCIHCGNQLPDNAKFCSTCGKAVEKNDFVHQSHEDSLNNILYQSSQEQSCNDVNQELTSDTVQKNIYYTPSDPNNNQYQRKKKKSGCFIIFAVLCIIIFLLIVFIPLVILNVSDPNVDVVGNNLEVADVRDFYTTINNDGSDIATIMVYMIGSDLESEDGFASFDINEMMTAKFGDNVNLILMTGGATNWTNENIRSDTCQYWQIKDSKLISIDNDLGLLNMTSKDTLANFISDTARNYPANRYGLVLWDHGGGTLGGFGYDENYPDDYMTMVETSQALSDADVKFDFIGYDACLMGTAEIAMTLEPYADYLIASEESVESVGWSYTGWLTALGNDTSISTLDLGKTIIDNFIDSHILKLKGVLSIIELRQMPYTYEIMSNYFSNASGDLFDKNDYTELSAVRNNTKEFGEGEFEQIDIIDFALKSNLEGSDELIGAINNAVKYYRHTDNMSDVYGLAIYFPYDYPENYSNIYYDMTKIGYDTKYLSFFNNFVSIMCGAKIYNNSHDDTFSYYKNEEWFNNYLVTNYEDFYEANCHKEFLLDFKNGSYVLSLPDAQWDEITNIELQVFLDDVKGCIDLGRDNVYDFNDDGDLIINFDYTWVSLDGVIIPFYFQEEFYNNENDWYSYGYAPARLNGEDFINVVIYWDNEHPNGYVAGYKKETDGPAPAGKGLLLLKDGDLLEWCFDYYTHDLEYVRTHIADSLTFNSNMEVYYTGVVHHESFIYFRLTDIYNNVYETETVVCK